MTQQFFFYSLLQIQTLLQFYL